MSFLVLDRLSKRYSNNYAVKSLSLKVEKGEFIALLGPSGCGKTTTLQMIAGFVEPTGGTIELAGRDLLASKPSGRGLGIVFQSYALFPHMTVAENVAFGLEMRNVGRAERDARVIDVLGLIGLTALADRYPRRMSGGQQQRVALARALVVKPEILLLDEPLSNLDAKLREGMQIELRQIQRTLGTTTLLVTHDQGEAMALADRIVVMNNGEVEQIGAPFDIYEWPATPFVANFLGKTNVLAGFCDAGVVRLQNAVWSVDNIQLGPVDISIRPEKVKLTAAGGNGIAAFIKTRIFQGNHWLYEADVMGCKVTIITPNDGGQPAAENDPVWLEWRAEDMRVRPIAQRAAQGVMAGARA